MNQRVLQRTLKQMVERLVTQFDPDQIILFGSHARGDARPHSDIDLLVVMPVQGPRRAKQVEMRVALHDWKIPKDIFVVTPAQVEQQRNVIGTLIQPALKEGRVLYVRPGSGDTRRSAVGSKSGKRPGQRRKHAQNGSSKSNRHRMLSRTSVRRKVSQGASDGP
jgi:predicted nucleotidyltransferase